MRLQTEREREREREREIVVGGGRKGVGSGGGDISFPVRALQHTISARGEVSEVSKRYIPPIADKSQLKIDKLPPQSFATREFAQPKLRRLFGARYLQINGEMKETTGTASLDDV